MRSHVFLPRSMRPKRVAAELAALAAAIFCVSGCTPEPAPAPGPLDDSVRARVTVSGISAGGYMAVQTHVALADLVGGVAALAAGPYHCAEGSVRTALSRCLGAETLDATPFIDYARSSAAAGKIAGLEHLSAARVWLFHSRDDTVVSAPVADALAAFYAAWVEPQHIAYVTDLAVAHGWPTLATGSACTELGGDYLNACGYDAAGALLAHLYGELKPRTDSPGRPVSLDISAHLGPGTHLLEQAYAYFPPGCGADSADCRLHIALHGCRQGSEFIDDRFVTGAGLNEWAATNGIVVVYPQVAKSLANPQGCWDWWGYTGEDYDLRTGKQIAALGRIVAAWARGELRAGR